MTTRIIIAMFLALATLTLACDWIDDIEDEILGDDDRDRDLSHKRPYRYFEALALPGGTATIDPYDGSLDVIEPGVESRVSISTGPDAGDAAVLNDGTSVAVLEYRLNEVRLVDTTTYAVKNVVTVGQAVNRLVAAPVGPYLLAVYDADHGAADYGETGVINYFEIDIINVEDGSILPVSIDFSPDRIVFTEDGAHAFLGKTSRLVDLSLADGDAVTYPLTLDPNDGRSARTVITSSDGAFAVALLDGSNDVYVIDRVAQSINILDMQARPNVAAFVPDTHVVMITVPNRGTLAVVNLDAPIPAEVDLPTSMGSMLVTPDGSRALLYDIAGGNMLCALSLSDVVTWASDAAGEKIEPDSQAMTTFTLSGWVTNESVARPVMIDGTSQYAAVVVYGAVSPYELNIVNLNADDAAGRVAAPLGLEGPPRDMVFSTASTSLGVLLASAEKLVVIDLPTLAARARPLGPVARSLHYVPEAGMFAVDYNHRRGKIAFVGDQDPDYFWFAIRIFDPK